MGYYYGYGGENMFWLLAMLVIVLVSVLVQSRMQSVFKRYSMVVSSQGLTAAQAARAILDANNCATRIELTSGNLTDHYDPRADVVRLSESTYSSTSIAAIGVAAHECGHVLQDKQGYAPMQIRNFIVPAVSIGSQLSMPLLIIGIFLGFTQLAFVGVALYALAVAFQLITLPVEFDASRRAVEILSSKAMISQNERPAVEKVLRAAAMTYVVAALASVVQLLRFISMAKRNRR